MVKMTKTEHIVIITLIILCAFMVVQISSCAKELEQSDSVRKTIIDVGKEIKSIYNEIVED